MIFPWQTAQWEQLARAKRENRLPHALLLSGIAGIGKMIFADHFARALLCQHEGDDISFCGRCHSCLLIAGRTHPNVLWLEPEEDSRTIKIDQVRAVSDFINQSSLQGDTRIVIINPANAMNINAANALLKTLEEPSKGALLMLISNQYEGLPATILSRCQKVSFSRPETAQALRWLAEQPEKITEPALLLRLANGAPLAALQLMRDDALNARQTLFKALYSLSQQHTDPIKTAAQLKDMEPVKLLDDMLSWTMDIMRLQLGGDTTELINTDFEKQIQDLTQRTKLADNVKRLNYLQAMRGQLASGLNLNKQLIAENALMRFL